MSREHIGFYAYRRDGKKLAQLWVDFPADKMRQRTTGTTYRTDNEALSDTERLNCHGNITPPETLNA